MPDEVLHDIAGFLAEWRAVATGPGPFRWEVAIDRCWLSLLVRYWANLDVMTDDLVARLGLAWAPLSTRPFFDALVAGVDRTLRTPGSGAADPFARLLAR